MEDLIPIGQFAAASRLSLKALRLYDENGLLRPAQLARKRRLVLVDSGGARIVHYSPDLDKRHVCAAKEPDQRRRSELVEPIRAIARLGVDAFTVYHGEVNEQDGGPIEVCLPVAAAEKKLPAGEVAYTVAVGEQTTFPEIIGAYDAVSGWAKANGRELAGPPREIYLDEATDNRPHMEIAWPVQ